MHFKFTNKKVAHISLPLIFKSWVKEYCVIVFLSTFILSCNNKEANHYEKPSTLIQAIDSFTIYDISGSSGLLLFSNMSEDKSLIYLGSPVGNTISIYQRNSNGDYTFKENKDYFPYESATFIEMKGSVFYFLRDKKIFTYDTLNKVEHVYKNKEKKKYLGDEYIFTDYNFHPLIFNHDTVIAGFYHNNPKLQNEWLKEKALSIYKMNGDSLIHLKNTFDRPSALKGLKNIDFSYNQVDRKLSFIFNCLDTIYTYDLNRNVESKTPIHNPNFKENKKYDFTKAFDQSYDANYDRENFRYEGFFFNENTKHYVLFYLAPYLEKNPIPYESNLYVMVLDKEFKPLNHYNLGNNTLHGVNMINVPGKGFAIPKINYNLDEKFLVFHIYNF